jgi:hypothetical protein
MWYWPLILVVVVLVLLSVVVLVVRKRKPKNFAGADVYRSLMGAPPTGAAASANDPKLEPLRQNLRLKLLYQEDKVDAAIEFERERNPTATLEECMKAAIARWERDNK